MRIRNRVLLLLVLQFNLLIGKLAAQPDSLLHEFKKIPKTAANISRLIDLSYNLTDYKVDSALNCAYQIRQISLPDNDYKLHCEILINLGNIAKLSGKYDESNKYLFQALEIAEKNNLISFKIMSLCQIGDLNRCIGLLDLSLYYLYLSKNLAHKNKVSQQYPELYEHISSSFYELTEHTHPKFKLTKIPFQTEFNLESSATDVYYKLCKIYVDSALIISDLKNDNRTKLSCLNLLGAYYRQNQNFDKAIGYFSKAIELAGQINYKIDVPNYYTNIARTYFANKQYNKAIEYGLKAYQLAVDLNILVYKSTAAYILRISFIEMKDYKNALEYQTIEAGTREEMNSQQNWNKISELDKKYQSGQKQKEIEYQKNLLDLKNAEVYRGNIIIASLFIAFILIVIGIFYIQNQKTVVFKQKDKIQAQNEILLAQKEEIVNQYQKLEKLDQFKKTLTHALVHDLKNPLSQIVHNTENPTVQLSVRKMMRLIMNMLDVEKYETTQFKLNYETHSLYELLGEIKREQELSLKEKNLDLNLNFDDYLVKADKDIMMRVFDNLLTNAIRFSPQNRNIDVFAEKSGDDSVHIGIKNYGDPIPVEALPYIFDKYRQFQQKEGKGYQTTGLGLTFCKMALEAQGQKIEAKNGEDGVVFTFSLNGNINHSQMQHIVKEDFRITLSNDEKAVLQPFFDRLKNIEVYEVSDILLVLNEIPAETENITALKQQISDAAFATNLELYCQIIHL